MLAGTIAGSIEGLFLHVPIENMKVKLIHDKVMPQPKYRSMFDGINRIFKKQRWHGITRGALPNTMKEASNHAVRFPVFHILQGLSSPYIHKNVVRDVLVGVATGCISAAVNQPLDVIKTNLQGLKAHKYEGMSDCMSQIYNKEGLGGFYKGL